MCLSSQVLFLFIAFFLNKITKKNILCDRTVPVFVWMCAGMYSDAASWLLYNWINGTVSLSAWMWKDRLGFAQSHRERALSEKQLKTSLDVGCTMESLLSDWWEGSSGFEYLILFVSLETGGFNAALHALLCSRISVRFEDVTIIHKSSCLRFAGHDEMFWKASSLWAPKKKTCVCVCEKEGECVWLYNTSPGRSGSTAPNRIPHFAACCLEPWLHRLLLPCWLSPLCVPRLIWTVKSWLNLWCWTATALWVRLGFQAVRWTNTGR